ncbi:heat-inducible transcriptional repressor HrcA [Kroppenstedtia eburnea]|uniref:Heat-inducible transcription repressor HrcA n=1 Tax=Kroppenstedtia eburnea TaxID=714067 RepID=A0A1N7KYJ2_9BACL|nr:heat-inducible transcriptional repressor HrcA [Kroppenstedtia eburnea]EGK12659.1 heat-inducible transcription repressor HrcA [Desmospora sp. 8437]QKI82747.1 heat-inducible transcription repressor HrcA [Kroppenstedtia eburnea]SIS66689.1 heat-inducible transcription repressor HrcA [Kroppenstedtia eburnea]
MLSERQQKILRAIVDEYIVHAEPVGSRTVSKREDIGFSAATVRNEMADLEEMGFLEQPHTSAGRIPSQIGYRYYVDHLMGPERLKRSDLIMIRQLFASQMDALEQTIQQTVSILSRITNYTSIMLGPELYDNKLKHLQVIPLHDRMAVVILVTDTGHVDQRRITVPEGVSLSWIEQMVNLLNAKLSGVPLFRLKRTVYKELYQELSRHAEHYEYLQGIIDQMLVADQEGRIFTSGTTNILTQPEFKDVEKVKALMELFEETDTVVQLLSNQEDTGVQIRIGQENHLEAVNNCSIVSASFTVNGRSLGTIGVLGPTRMDYRKVVSLLEVLTRDFSEHLRRIYG